MTETFTQPQNEAEQAEVDYGEHLIWRLIGSKITMFGANAQGEIFFSVDKGGKQLKLIIGKDEAGEISLFEVEEGATA